MASSAAPWSSLHLRLPLSRPRAALSPPTFSSSLRSSSFPLSHGSCSIFIFKPSGLLFSEKRRKREGCEDGRALVVCQSQVLDLAPTAAAAYGLALLGGGLFAYLRSGSKGSLFGGLAGGVSLAAAYFLLQTSERQDIGCAVGFGAALLFVAVFGIRFAATRKVMPAGLLLAVSIAAAVEFFNAYFEARI